MLFYSCICGYILVIGYPGYLNVFAQILKTARRPGVSPHKYS